MPLRRQWIFFLMANFFNYFSRICIQVASSKNVFVQLLRTNEIKPSINNEKYFDVMQILKCCIYSKESFMDFERFFMLMEFFSVSSTTFYFVSKRSQQKNAIAKLLSNNASRRMSVVQKKLSVQDKLITVRFQCEIS